MPLPADTVEVRLGAKSRKRSLYVLRETHRSKRDVFTKVIRDISCHRVFAEPRSEFF